MTSIDRRSLYSTSTLVGGGDDEPQERSRGHLSMELNDDTSILEEGPYSFRQPFINVALPPNRNDGALSRQSSVTTLYAQPSRRTPPRPRLQGNLAPTSSLSASTPPRIAAQGEGNNAQYDLRVPWWSAMMPSPVIERRKSNGRIRVDSTSNVAPPPVPSSSSSSSSNAVPNGLISSALDTGSTTRIPRSRSKLASPIPPPLPSDYPLYAKCYCEENAYLLAAYLSRTCHLWNQHESSATKETYVKWGVDVVVVSNKNQTVALWQQKAGLSASSDYQVVWDYHVFVVVSCQKRNKVAANGESSNTTPPRSRSLFSRGSVADNVTRTDGAPTSSWVYDLDSRLVTPISLTKYLSATFGIENGAIATLNKRFQPLFRVISANDYFVRFGSDRSHMKVASNSPDREDAEWLQPRPEWDLILGCKADHSNNYFLDSFVDMRVRVGDGRFGVIVKLEELYTGQGLMAGREDYQETTLAAGVAVLLDRVGDENDATMHEHQEGESLQSHDSVMIPLEEDEMDRTPGVMIGGVVRLGIRPPPPPPDGAVIAPNRGKRVMDPLYPAYILKAYEHRMGDDESNLSTS